MVGTLCFLSARNLGDAVFHSEFLKALIEANYADRYLVWTFREARFLFEGLDRCRVIESDFPMGASMRRFLRGGYAGFWRAMRAIRRERPDETLELVADVRERFAVRLLGAKRNLSPAWAPGHLFRRHNRIGPCGPSGLGTVPREVANLYAAYDLALKTLLGHGSPAFEAGRRPHRDGPPAWLGIHPSASASFKLWPQERWVALIHALRAEHPALRLVLFGAPHERAKIEQLNAAAGGCAEVFTASLAEFRERLSRLDLLVGLDSFSVHLAHSVGVPAVVLIGPNDPALFTPPSARAVSVRSSCPHQPCGGRPRCVGTSFEYACMREIEVADVMAGVHALPDRRDAGPGQRAESLCQSTQASVLP